MGFKGFQGHYRDVPGNLRIFKELNGHHRGIPRSARGIPEVFKGFQECSREIHFRSRVFH